MADHPILVVGESLVDIVIGEHGETTIFPGGSPANVAVSLARLGADVQLATAYASDEDGDLLDQHFISSGVTLVGDPHQLPRTSSAKAVIGRGGSATYDFDLLWELAMPVPAQQPALVHIGSVAALLQPGADVVLEVVRRFAPSATISFDINARPAATGMGGPQRSRIEELASYADLVQASDDDLAIVWPSLDTEAAARHLIALGAGAVAVTRGHGGASCVTPRGSVLVHAQPVTVVDTIGAGDSFCAGVLDGLRLRGLLGPDARPRLRSLSVDGWRDVLERACRVAAITVSRAGPNPPTAAELEASAGQSF
jgi:fructokinase